MPVPLDAGRMDAARVDAGRRDAGAHDTGPEVDAGFACSPPLTRCDAGGAPCCAGSECVDPCGTGGLCSVPGRDTCGCGAVPDECDGPELECLFTFCDAPGICVTAEERREICARADRPECFVCPECNGEPCEGPPPPVCVTPTRVRQYTEEWVDCDRERCVYASATFDCAEGTRCVDGECVEDGCGACPPGTVCCDPSGCEPGAPPRCVPDPSPCIEPVAARGCDGGVYGTACQALAAGVCVDECVDLPYTVLSDFVCATDPMDGVVALRERADFDPYFECAIPFMPPDFATHDVVIACYGCACAGRVGIDSVRDCAGEVTVAYSYPELCEECDVDACRRDCLVLEVPNLPPVVRGEFSIRVCPAGCCDS